MVNTFSNSTAYGKRAKLGLIVPPTNTVNEAEWHIMLPPDISLHVTRMPLHTDVLSKKGKEGLYRDIEKSTTDLGMAGLTSIAYGCTAGSMADPINELTDFMSKISGIPCVSTAGSIIAALNYLKVKKLSIATPYHEELNNHETLFLERNGFNVLSISGLGFGSGGAHEYIQIAQTPIDKIKSHILSVNCDAAEALLISCTDFPSLNLIPELEQEIGKPIISSNQATLWWAIRSAGIDDFFVGYGKLFET